MLPLLRKRGAGSSIVGVSSIEGFRAIPNCTVYASFKAALTGFTKSLALELGPAGIRVNQVAPETTETPQVPVSAMVAAEHHGHVPRWIPLGASARPAISRAPRCSSRPLAAWVTGTTLHVDGGALAAAGWYRDPNGFWTNLPVVTGNGFISERHRSPVHFTRRNGAAFGDIMKILIVGGTGLIGGHAALHLHAQGNSVTLAARKPPAPGSALARFDVLLRDYVAGNFTRDDLAPFDAVVFAAGNDIRHLPPGTDEAAHWERANVDAVPLRAGARGRREACGAGRQLLSAGRAGARRHGAVRTLAPSRRRTRALATPSFAVCSVNAPFVVGSVPGLRNEMFAAYTGYAQGQFAGLPVFGRPAAAISSRRNRCRKRSGAHCSAAKRAKPTSSATRISASPITSRPSSARPAIRGTCRRSTSIRCCPTSRSTRGAATSCRTADPADSALLRYRRGDVQRAVDEVVAHCRAQ